MTRKIVAWAVVDKSGYTELFQSKIKAVQSIEGWRECCFGKPRIVKLVEEKKRKARK